MDQQLKERLVGATVLALLAVLFVPVILDGPDETHTTHDIPLPPADSNPAPEQTYHFDLQTGNPVPQSAADKAAAQATQSEPPQGTSEGPAQTEPAKTKATAKPEPSVEKPEAESKSQSTPAVDGWTVQVGSFSTEARAMHLRDELRGKDYPAFIVPFKDGAQQYYRVRVGPEATRAEAESLAKRLQAETGSAVRVVSPP